MRSVLEEVDAMYIGFLDSDGAFSAHDVKRLTLKWLEEIESGKYSTLWASRVEMAGRNIVRNSTRHYAGRILSTLIMFRNSPIAYDTQCGFKLFAASDSFKKSLEPRFETRWFFDLELFIRIRQIDPEYKIYEEPLNSWYDISGSKVKKNQFIKILLEAQKIRFLLSKIN
jgi:hypothetical protein